MNDLPVVQSPFPARPSSQSGGLVEVESQRAIAETQAAMVIAKKFPRNQAECMDRILQAFTRPALAESAQYQYSRGGTDIVGPSIRAAETLAQEWGNISFGIRELTQANGESEVESFAWDIERNTRQVKTFKVPHSRYSKAKGNTRLEDPRDIYEAVANQGARRLRACILGIIPGDVVEAAMRQAEITLKTQVEVTPELIKKLLESFDSIGVTREMLEKKIQRSMDAIAPASVVQLRRIFTSIKDGVGSVPDYFEVAPNAEPAPNKGAAGLKAAVTKPDAQDAALKDLEKGSQDAQADAGGDKSGKPSLTFAKVSERLNKAFNKRDLEMLHVEADLIKQVADEKQRDDLTAEYKRMAGELDGE